MQTPRLARLTDSKVLEMKSKTFSVWVDGSEFNSHYMDEPEAERMAETLKNIGYESVVVRDESAEETK